MAVFSATGKVVSPTRLEVSARQFTLTIDEPPNLGGEDAGANPVEFVLAALMGCLNVVIHTVAKEKGVEVRSLALSAEGDLDPAGFMGKDDSVRAGYQEIRLEVIIDADADEATVREIAEISKKRCPVSDNLANVTPVSIDTVISGS